MAITRTSCARRAGVRSIWREEYYLSRSRAMEKIGENEDAARSWMQLSEVTDNPILMELAKWHRISLGASQ